MASKYKEATKGLLRSTILGSVTDVLRTKSWEATSMTDVAEAAGVSRQSIYNEFGNREELFAAYALVETESFLAAIESAIATNAGDFRAGVHAAVDVFLETAAVHPLLSAIAAGEVSSDVISRFVTERDSAVLGFAAIRLAEVLQKFWPALDTKDIEQTCELVARLALSHLSQPASPFGYAPADLIGLLDPSLERMIEQADKQAGEKAGEQAG